MEIKKWDIFMVNFNPARWSEQSWIRPAVIIQNDIWNKFWSTVIISAITSTNKDFPFFVFIKKTNLNWLTNDSSINTSQILTLDKIRLIKKLWKLNNLELQKLDNSLKISLWLN